MAAHTVIRLSVSMARPPAIHEIYRECPSDDVVLVFGDGAIYRYPSGILDALAVRSAANHGYAFNLPAIRRRAWPAGLPYERLDDLPAGALLLYSEPPYEAAGLAPACPVIPVYPDTVCADSTWEAFTATFFGCSISPLTVFSAGPPPIYTGSACGYAQLIPEPIDPPAGWFFEFQFLTYDIGYIHAGASPLGEYTFAAGPGPAPAPSMFEMIACP